MHGEARLLAVKRRKDEYLSGLADDRLLAQVRRDFEFFRIQVVVHGFIIVC